MCASQVEKMAQKVPLQSVQVYGRKVSCFVAMCDLNLSVTSYWVNCVFSHYHRSVISATIKHAHSNYLTLLQ